MISSKTSFITYDPDTGALVVTLRDENGKEPDAGWFPAPIVAVAEASSQPYLLADGNQIPFLGGLAMKFGANHFTLADVGTGTALGLGFDDWPTGGPLWPVFDSVNTPGAFDGDGNFVARVGIVCGDGVVVTNVLTIATTP